MKKTSVAFLSVAMGCAILLGASLTTVQARGGGSAGHQRGGVEANYMPGTQNLSQAGVPADKIQLIQEIKKRHQAQAEPLMQQLHEQRKSLMTYMSGPTANEQQATQMSQTLEKTYSQLNAMHMKAWFEARQHLTPEQMQKLVANRQAHMQRMQAGRRSNGSRPMMPPHMAPSATMQKQGALAPNAKPTM
jgi:Spy/CpxP family protein refolding chaperone